MTKMTSKRSKELQKGADEGFLREDCYSSEKMPHYIRMKKGQRQQYTVILTTIGSFGFFVMLLSALQTILNYSLGAFGFIFLIIGLIPALIINIEK